MKVTATAEGNKVATEFLSEVIDEEVAFHNGRLDKLIAGQDARRVFLENQIKELSARVATVTDARDQVSQTEQGVGAWVALQQARMNAQDKIAKHRRELNAISLARASDLFVDTSAVVQAPVVIITSRWYRPVLYGESAERAANSFEIVAREWFTKNSPVWAESHASKAPDTDHHRQTTCGFCP